MAAEDGVNFQFRCLMSVFAKGEKKVDRHCFPQTWMEATPIMTQSRGDQSFGYTWFGLVSTHRSLIRQPSTNILRVRQ